MKNFYLSYFVLTLSMCLAIQTSAQNFVLVPDTDFQSYLSQEYPNADTVINGDFYIDADHPSVANETIMDIAPGTFINDLSGIEAFQSLEILDITNNHLNYVPSFPNSLIEIYLGSNSLSSIPTLPSNLEVLRVYDNSSLTSLPSLPGTLRELSCGQNINMPTLPSLPSSLEVLQASHGDLTSLPALPAGLILLHCLHNDNLSTLPTLPSSLNHLNFQGCSVSNPPPFPNSISILNCADNGITALDSLPTSLTDLYCGWNNLTELPPLPNNIQTVSCVHNDMTCLPAFPTSLWEFEFEGNPISCVPGYLSTMTDGLSYPLCHSNDTLSNPNACPSARGVMGKVFKDTANNCTDDLYGVKNIPLVLLNSNGDTIARTSSNIQGGYMFNIDPGTYTVSIDTSGLDYSIVAVCPSGLSYSVTTTPSTPVSQNNDFGVICNGFDLGTINPVPTGLVFPGQTHQVQISAGDVTNNSGMNCATGVDGEITVTVSGPADTIIFNGSPTLLNDSSATYSVADFALFAMDSIKLSILTDTSATVADSFRIKTKVFTTVPGQLTTNNDSTFYTYPVVNSYDPNKKEVSPALVDTGYVDPFTYTIYFQNTGNAPAINIRLEDVLSNKLDLNTFEFITASHYQTYSIDYTTRKLTIRYPEIFLVDSTTNFDESIGYFKFKINPVENLTGGTEIDNFVNIFFDFNAPIETNTATCTYRSYAGVSIASNNTDSHLILYPNPTKHSITLTAIQKIQTVAIYSIEGSCVGSARPEALQHTLDVSSLPAGMYFVHAIINGSKEVVKFVKE